MSYIQYIYTVQLKYNLTPAHAVGLPGEKVQVNLQTGAGKGAGARTFFTNPEATYGIRFDTSF